MSKIKERSGTFTDNMKLPIHRWFRYSAGYSAEWVKSEIERFEKNKDTEVIVFDPFLGSGTTAFAGESLGNKVYGFEGHPFVARIAKAKSYWYLDESDFMDACYDIINLSKINNNLTIRHNKTNLLGKCYDISALSKLDSLKSSYEYLADKDPLWELVWLNITSILRLCSKAGTAQWQYILPKKTKSKVFEVNEAFLAKAKLMVQDIKYVKSSNWTTTAHIYKHDARRSMNLPKCNLLITSPPYLNNYDYADSTRLEMMFWNEISGWKDLKTTIRPTMMRSCSQHSAADKIILDEILDDPLLTPILNSLFPIVKDLEKIRLVRGGKKTYHTMVAAYFLDMAKIINNCRKVMERGSEICFVIGDSAPYGVHVPVEKFIGKLALQAGFTAFQFEKLRDRNVKWKNRTHNVPLHEGRLWIKG